MSDVRVAVFDGCPITREGLRLVLLGFDLEVVATSGDAEELVRLCRPNPPDVLLLGPSIAAPDLLTVLRGLRVELPDPHVVVFRLFETADLAIACVAAGAAGYLSRASACEELAIAVRAVAKEARFLSRSAAELFTYRSSGEEPQPRHSRLSTREFEVFLLLAAGHTVGEIASRLDISPKTVSSHRARIREKTGLNSNAEIIRYALERSLV